MRSIYVLLLAAVVATGCGNEKETETTNDTVADTSHHESHGEMMNNSMMRSMQPAMDRMMAVKLSENMDIDFAAMMIPHHEAAVDMSREALKTAKDSFVIRIANKMIADQEREIAMMKSFLQKADTTNLIKNAPANEMHHMNKMMQAMHGIQPTGDSDKDFMRMMIPHHQGAIDMAQMELANGKDPGMRKLAADIVKAQKSEINAMNNRLKDL